MREALLADVRVVILAPFPPEGGGGGGVILRSLLDSGDLAGLAWFTLSPDSTQRTSWWRPELARASAGIRLPGRGRRWLEALYSRGPDALEARLVVSRAARFVASRQPDLCWFVVTPWAIPVLHALAQRLACPYHLTVHDDPVISADNLGAPLSPRRLAEFAELLRQASSIDCISQRLADHYASRYGVHPTTAWRGFDPFALARLEAEAAHPKSPDSILLAGWGDCPAPWPANLIEALRLLRSGGWDVVMHAFDPRLPRDLPFLHIHERLAGPDFDAFARRQAIGYAPDPLTPAGRRFAATSFSTKVVTYIGCGLPVLYHGPRDSVVGDLLADYPLGTVIEDQAPDAIAAGFRFIRDHYSAMRRACLDAARERFDVRDIRRRLFDHMRNTLLTPL